MVHRVKGLNYIQGSPFSWESGGWSMKTETHILRLLSLEILRVCVFTSPPSYFFTAS